MKNLKGIVISPTGQEHELDSIEEAARVVVILSDTLTKDNFDEIINELRTDPRKTYVWNGWTVKVDLTAKRKGVGVIVTKVETGEVAEFNTIKECALAMGEKQQKVRTLINGFNNLHNGFRYAKKDIW